MLTTANIGGSTRAVVPKKKRTDVALRRQIAAWVKWRLDQRVGEPESHRALERRLYLAGGTLSRCLSAERLGLDSLVKIIGGLRLDANQVLFEPPPKPRHNAAGEREPGPET